MDNKELKKIIAIKKEKKSFRVFWENFVFEHEWYFYKMPNIVAKTIFYSGKNSFEEVKKSFEIIKKYFWEVFVIPDTKIVEYKKGSYVIKQKKVDWKFLSKSILRENRVIKEKFKKLMIINEELYKEKWLFLDILWTDFIYDTNSIHNLMVIWNDIYLFDFWLLDKNSSWIIFKFVSKVAYKIQTKIINTFFIKYKKSYKD